MKVFVLVLRLLGAQLVMVIATGAVFGLFTVLGLADRIYDDYLVRAVADLAVAVAVTAAVLAYSHLLGGVRVREFLLGFDRRDAALVVLGTVVTLAAAAGYVLVLGAVGAREVTTVAPLAPVLAIGIIGEFGVIHEEVLSRGYFLRLLSSRLGILASILISSVLFSAGHAIFKHPDFMLVGHVFEGILLGYAYVKSGTLVVPILLHTAHNLAADLFLQGDDDGVSLGIGVLHFAPHLGPVERLAFDASLAAILLVLVWAVYSRGRDILAPHPRWLAAGRASAADRLPTADGVLSR